MPEKPDQMASMSSLEMAVRAEVHRRIPEITNAIRREMSDELRARIEREIAHHVRREMARVEYERTRDIERERWNREMATYRPNAVPTRNERPPTYNSMPRSYDRPGDGALFQDYLDTMDGRLHQAALGRELDTVIEQANAESRRREIARLTPPVSIVDMDRSDMIDSMTRMLGIPAHMLQPEAGRPSTSNELLMGETAKPETPKIEEPPKAADGNTIEDTLEVV